MGHSQDESTVPRLMDSQHLNLYNQLQTFEIDEPGVCFSFAQRLARDSRWSMAYTHQVIEEYKKFLFLAIAANHPVVPPDAVDEAWHLHLTYTESYWNNLCGRLLKRPTHHHPARRGSSQKEFFRECYQKTLSSYAGFFGYAPPASIWRPVTIRFGQSGEFRRINSQEYWLIPKPTFKPSWLLSLRFRYRFWPLAIAITALVFGILIGCQVLGHHSTIAFGWDTINGLVHPSAVAQTAGPDTLDSTAKDNAFRLSWWMILIGGILGLIGLLSLIETVDSRRCPNCKRLAMRTILTRIVREPTPECTGEKRITKQCSICQYQTIQVISTFKKVEGTGCACGR